MKTCLIFGHIGLDLDVTFNLRSFYRELGFVVIFSDKLYQTDLLVIVRGGDKPLDLKQYSYSLVHVYDYGGWDYSQLVCSLDFKNSYIFSTSLDKRTQIIKDFKFPENQIFIAFPPVDLKLWVEPLEDIKYEKVHIGNYKPIDGTDNYKEKFNNYIIKNSVNIWGLGWTSMVRKEYYHGKLGLFNVSKIYAKSGLALGLMYPFQREVTFSGRFWHAPINGCSVVSEPGLYTKKIPGIIETDYLPENIDSNLSSLEDRKDIARKAQQYWLDQKCITLSHVQPTLNLIPEKRINSNQIIIVLKVRLNNILKEFYQKWSIFKILNK